MKHPNLAHFWRLEKPEFARQQADWDDGMDLEQVICPRFPGHQRGGKRTTDLKVVLHTADLHDFIWFDYGGECVIQDRVLQIFRDNNVTGFEVKAVRARFDDSDMIPPIVWELVVTGWAGMAKPESGIRLDESASCSECGHLRYTGLEKANEIIDTDRWDGSDFFMVWPMPRHIFVSDRVINIIRDHQLTGTRPTLICELTRTNGFSPGRLHYYMPEERAKALGIPLGIY